jgi:hypothetical protein
MPSPRHSSEEITRARLSQVSKIGVEFSDLSLAHRNHVWRTVLSATRVITAVCAHLLRAASGPWVQDLLLEDTNSVFNVRRDP